MTGLGDLLPHRRADAERFAALVDGRRVNGGTADHPELAELARLAAALAPAEHRPDPAFRTALRERLVAEAASRPVPAARAAAPAASPGGDREHRPRWRAAVATVAIAAVVSGAGAAAASYRALPGDSLYGLKRQIESVELALAHGDLNRGRELLEQAEARLGEAERLAASSEISEPGTRADLVATLADMRRRHRGGQPRPDRRLPGDRRRRAAADPAGLRRRAAGAAARPDGAARPGSARRRCARCWPTWSPSSAAATILLGTSTAAATEAGAADLGAASGDGWAVSMLLDRTSSTAGDAGSTLADGTGSAGALSGPGSGDGGLVGGLVDGVTGVLDDGSGRRWLGGAPARRRRGGDTVDGVGDTVDGVADGVDGVSTVVDGVDGVGDTVDGVADGRGRCLDPVTSPLGSSTPLPTSAPLPSLDPSAVTSPLPTVSVCVTLLGVETC